MIPKEYRLIHEYCFFLHDECARVLVEYEKEQGHIVSFDFKDEAEAKCFKKFKGHPLDAMRSIGRSEEARRVVINTITMAMVSDCLHHLYEALRCSEKRKFVVALNLLRKPLTDSLFFLSWMLGDEGDFYEKFTANSPKALSSKHVGGRRLDLFSKAIEKTKLRPHINVSDLVSTIYDSKNVVGLYGLFQQAVHLITAERIEIQTSPENFNFIFKSPLEDDFYEGLYLHLPSILLFLSHVVLELFERMHPMSVGAKSAFECRSILAFWLLQSSERTTQCVQLLQEGLASTVTCPSCSKALSITLHNASRILLSESYRCTHCKTVSDIPFSYSF